MAAGGTPFNGANYTRFIELLEADAETQIAVLCDKAQGIDFVEDAKFELLRQGGCGPGDFRLVTRFPYETVDIGHYIRCKYTSDGDPVYLGKILDINIDSPSGVSLTTDGPMSDLNEVQVGGFNSEELMLQHLFAASDWFINDPDRNLQSWDFVDTVPGLIQKLFDGYIALKTNIGLGTIANFAGDTVPFNSSVFRGQENVSTIIRALAVQQKGASYGVDANNEFFFIPRATSELHTFREGLNLTKLSKSMTRDLLYNKLIINGDYVYNPFVQAQPFYVWQSPHANASSIAQYGARKITLYIPWVRNWADAEAFATEFFNIYSNAIVRYTGTTIGQGAVFNPWDGTLGLLDRTGADLVRSERFDRIEVEFNKAPIITFTLGPEDLQFPVTPEPRRWELPFGGKQSQQQSEDSESSESSWESASLESSEASSEGTGEESSEEPEETSDGSGDPMCGGHAVQVLTGVDVRCSDGTIVVEEEFIYVPTCVIPE